MSSLVRQQAFEDFMRDEYGFSLADFEHPDKAPYQYTNWQLHCNWRLWQAASRTHETEARRALEEIRGALERIQKRMLAVDKTGEALFGPELYDSRTSLSILSALLEEKCS